MAANRKKGISLATLGVVNRPSFYDELSKIKVPTLIMVGDQDVATVPAKSQRMQQQIANSKLVYIPGAGHTSSVEEPEFVNAELTQFLSKL
jgi:pimeloyl-ACP methyl ester carboxylesterase